MSNHIIAGTDRENILQLVREAVTFRQNSTPLNQVNGGTDIDERDFLSGATQLSGLTELDLELDESLSALWCFQRHNLRPNFTPELIADVRHVQKTLKSLLGTMNGSTSGDTSLKYLIWASGRKGIFNLGGDLNHFVNLILDQDRESIWHYAKSCVDICYDNYINLNLPIITISLVQGDALGGGFESVLSSDVIVAERSAQFGLPEILFGLFPGMGAYSFLCRRLGSAAAENMIFSGRIFRGEELHDMGLVDVLAEDGRGEETLYAYLKKKNKRFFTHRSLYQVRRTCRPVTMEELLKVAEQWTETALTLSEIDIRKMRRLAKAQMSRANKSLKMSVKGQAKTASQMMSGTGFQLDKTAGSAQESVT